MTEGPDHAGGINTLGVTGGIGSGKSLACRYLSELGAEVFEADLVAKQLMEQSGEVRQAVEQTFGIASYLPDGRLNRAWLAGRVFDDDEELAKLNAIVHPAVRQAFDQTRSGCQAPLIVHEAALIFEAGLDTELDAVAVITAPIDMRIQWVRQRDRVTARQVRQRMAHQLPQSELERRADVVVVNGASPNALRRKISHLFELAASARPLDRATFSHCRRL